MPSTKRKRKSTANVSKTAGSNWSRIQQALQKERKTQGKEEKDRIPQWKKQKIAQRKKNALMTKTTKKEKKKCRTREKRNYELAIKGPEKPGELTDVVAMDCEMVGVSKSDIDDRSVLARATVVNFHGDVLYDEFVKPLEKVTYYRTHVSGVRPRDLYGGGAVTFKKAQNDIAAIIKGRVLVGHALHNDLTAMMLSHPKNMIRDTAKFKPMLRARANGRKARPKALRQLTKELLGVVIQDGAHSPVIDARAALELYKKYKGQWESLLSHRRRKTEKRKEKDAKKMSELGTNPNPSGATSVRRTSNQRKQPLVDEALW